VNKSLPYYQRLNEKPPLSGEQASSTPVTSLPQLLSRDDLATYYGITYSRKHLWRLMRAGTFPRPVALGTAKYARKAWRRQDIEAFIASRPVVDYDAKDAAAPPAKKGKSKRAA
jgi:predicted DNA-binding transcriptional regulator AlpA